MRRLRASLHRILGLFRRSALEAELNAELQAHLDGLTERYIAKGLSLDEARYAALREFGGVEQVREKARDQRRAVWLEGVGQDIRHAFRQLRKSPVFTTVAVASLALGIGANVAIFSVLERLSFRPLPVPEPERLVIVRNAATYARFDLLRKGAVTSLAGVFAVGHAGARRTVLDLADRQSATAMVQEVSGEFFPVLGEPAYLGRWLTPDDDRPHAARPVVVMSYAFWQRRLAGDPAALGRSLTINEVPVTIVGVMPPEFFGVDAGIGRSVELWCPLWLKQQLDDSGQASRLTTSAATSGWLNVMGRLQPGVTLEQANAELAVFSASHPLPGANNASHLSVRVGETGYNRVLGSFRQPLNILWAIAGVVLLVACANVGGLLLARGAARQREIAVRLALGASRARVARQLLTESLLLALLGGASGWLLANWGAAALSAYMNVTLGPTLNLRLFFVACLGATLTGILFGLIPALHFSGLNAMVAFKGGLGSSAPVARQRLNAALVAAQVALSFTLLFASGLLVQTLRNLRAKDHGFALENTVQFNLDLGGARSDADRMDIYRRAVAEIETLPGVRSAAISQGGPNSRSNSSGGNYAIDGVSVGQESKDGILQLRGSHGYFATKGIVLLRGRDFAPEDDEPGARRVAVISETVARRYLPHGDPVGRMLQSGRQPPAEIVGVARDAKGFALRESAGPTLYFPWFQQPDHWQTFEFVVRIMTSPAAFLSGLRPAMHRVDAQAEVVDYGTIGQLLNRNFFREQTVAELAGFFSLMTLLLSGIGLYGMLAYHVTQRSREFGVRVALGAQVRDIVRLVLGRGMTSVLTGCLLGVAGAWALGRFIGSLLFEVSALNPWAFGVAGLLLAVTALLACSLPARRAAQVDPMVALRAE